MPLLSQISRRVEDLGSARAFWRDVLLTQELFACPGLAFFDLGQTRPMLRETEKCDEADIPYLNCPDIVAGHADLLDRGAVFTGAPHKIHKHPDGTDEWMALFKDDERRDLPLHSLSRP